MENINTNSENTAVESAAAAVSANTPIIDFSRLKEIIPQGGALNLIFFVKGDEITVIYAPKHVGKEKDDNLAPMKFEGTADELTAKFAEIADLAALEKEFVEASNSTPSSSSVAARKEKLQNAITKAKDAKTKPASSSVKATPDKKALTGAEDGLGDVAKTTKVAEKAHGTEADKKTGKDVGKDTAGQQKKDSFNLFAAVVEPKKETPAGEQAEAAALDATTSTSTDPQDGEKAAA